MQEKNNHKSNWILFLIIIVLLAIIFWISEDHKPKNINTVETTFEKIWRSPTSEELVAIGKIMVANNLIGCGEFYLQETTEKEYTVACTSDGTTWNYYVVYSAIGKIYLASDEMLEKLSPPDLLEKDYEDRLVNDKGGKDSLIVTFEKLLKSHFDSYRENKREEVTELGGGWVKEFYELDGKYEYNIQKTSSNPNEYDGYCLFTLKKSFSDFYNSKQEARNATIPTQSDLISHKHYFCYKNGKWNVYKRFYNGLNKWYDCNEIISSGNNKGLTNFNGCWEENIVFLDNNLLSQ